VNQSIYFSGIKDFFIILCSVYTYGKIINYHFSRKAYLLSLIFSIITTPLVCFVQITFPLYTILVMTIFVMLFCRLLFKRTAPHFFYYMPILSIGCSYALFAFSILLTSPITYFLFAHHISNTVITALILPAVGILQNLLVYFVFRTKRFRNGIPSITNILLGDGTLFVGALLIIFSSAFYLNEKIRNAAFHLLLISFILALSIIIYLWLQKGIHTDYLCKSHTRRIDMLEDTLREKDAELERLSKIIHKDNKLLAALEHSTRELLADAPNEKAQRLLQELNRFSKERTETLASYEEKPVPFTETGLFSIDTMLRYLYQRALKHKIDFQIQLDEHASSITGFISEQDLCTIIADLGENAIIATKDAETKNILLSLEKRMQSYTLCIYDSGEAFSKEVLENLGQRRYTTHAQTGGSGIGLMTTSELARKYKADFDISEQEIAPPYTKRVSFTLYTDKPVRTIESQL